LVHSLA